MTAGNEARLISRLTRLTRSGCVSGSSTSVQVVCSDSGRGSARGSLERVNDKLLDPLRLRRERLASARLPGDRHPLRPSLTCQCSTVGLDADPVVDGVLKAFLTGKRRAVWTAACKVRPTQSAGVSCRTPSPARRRAPVAGHRNLPGSGRRSALRPEALRA